MLEKSKWWKSAQYSYPALLLQSLILCTHWDAAVGTRWLPNGDGSLSRGKKVKMWGGEMWRRAKLHTVTLTCHFSACKNTSAEVVATLQSVWRLILQKQQHKKKCYFCQITSQHVMMSSWSWNFCKSCSCIKHNCFHSKKAEASNGK